ncbi:MAG: GNAT family N-acetyltransferase, partial [Planctomycetes bacterium]|nr:GNAT family N-acetyltransferase [Planctomycetota bacterium]
MGDRHSRVTTLPPGYRVERFEPTELPPEELTRVAELQQSLKHERVVEDPLTPLEMFESWMRLPLPGRWRAFFKAHDGSGAVVGWGGVLRKLNDPENPHQLGWEIGIHPAHRRRGVGRALLRQIIEAVAGQGEDLVFAAQATD